MLSRKICDSQYAILSHFVAWNNSLGASFCPLTLAVASHQTTLCWRARKREDGAVLMPSSPASPVPSHLPPPVLLPIFYCRPREMGWKWGKTQSWQQFLLWKHWQNNAMRQQSYWNFWNTEIFATSSSESGRFVTSCRILDSQLMLLLAGHCDLSEFACNSFYI